MDFRDERYVRLYTRDTLTWHDLGWAGRQGLALLLRRLDRSGVLEIGQSDPASALSRLEEMPIEIAQLAIARMSELGVIQTRPGCIVVPRFIEAQEAAKSDRQRQRESRERRRQAALQVDDNKSQQELPLSQNVTGFGKIIDDSLVCHEMSRLVKRGVVKLGLNSSLSDLRAEEEDLNSSPPPRARGPEPSSAASLGVEQPEPELAPEPAQAPAAAREAPALRLVSPDLPSLGIEPAETLVAAGSADAVVGYRWLDEALGGGGRAPDLYAWREYYSRIGAKPLNERVAVARHIVASDYIAACLRKAKPDHILRYWSDFVAEPRNVLKPFAAASRRYQGPPPVARAAEYAAAVARTAAGGDPCIPF